MKVIYFYINHIPEYCNLQLVNKSIVSMILKSHYLDQLYCSVNYIEHSRIRWMRTKLWSNVHSAADVLQVKLVGCSLDWMHWTSNQTDQQAARSQACVFCSLLISLYIFIHTNHIQCTCTKNGQLSFSHNLWLHIIMKGILI